MFMMVIGLIIKEMEQEFIYGKMDQNIMDNGNNLKWMDKELLHLQMELLLLGLLKMINMLFDIIYYSILYF